MTQNEVIGKVSNEVLNDLYNALDKVDSILMWDYEYQSDSMLDDLYDMVNEAMDKLADRIAGKEGDQ